MGDTARKKTETRRKGQEPNTEHKGKARAEKCDMVKRNPGKIHALEPGIRNILEE